MNSLVDWDRLKPYNSNQNKSFEELCYQLAFEEYSSNGVFTSIDDSGGGDGVEFFLKLPNGDIWGWQCKFFGRFGESNRKSQIKSSLQKAYDTHGKTLKKWILCSRLSLTNEEREWFTSGLEKATHKKRIVLPKEHTVQLTHLGDTELINSLRKNQDIHRYFFSDKILDFDWYKSRFDSIMDSSVLKTKYLNVLHVAGEVDERVIEILADNRLADLIEKRKRLLNVDEFLYDYEEGVKEILDRKINFKFIDDYVKIKKYVLSEDYPNIINVGNVLLENLQNILRLNDSENLSIIKIELNMYKAKLIQFYIGYSTFKEFESISSFHWDTEKNENNPRLKEQIKSCRNMIFAPYFTIRNYIDGYTMLLESLEYHDINDFHICGDASKGKTHVAVSIVEYLINEERPAIFLFGKNFRENSPIKSQLKVLLDLPDNWSVENFFGALNISGRIKNTKAVLLIDGLNESIHWKQIWNTDLDSLINEINKKYPNVLLITTYRKSYENQLFSEKYFNYSNGNFNKKITVDGFKRESINEAIKRYFEYYQITLLNHSLAMNNFNEPLYLKLFCEAKKGKKVSFQNEDLFDVFEQYLNKINIGFVDKLGLSVRYNKNFLGNNLKKISNLLWEHSRRDVNLRDVLPILIGESELEALELEDILIYRDWGQEEIITFTYDLLSGYLIAKLLLENINTSTSFVEFVQSDKFNKELVVRETLHPLYDSILRSLCVLGIKKFGLTFYHEKLNGEFKHYLIKSLFEINTKLVIENKEIAIALVSESFVDSVDKTSLYKLFRNTEFNLDHPLNFELLSNLLFNLSLPDRDLSWTEYIREEYDCYRDNSLKTLLNNFEKEFVKVKDASMKIHLVAKKILWLMTSTNRDLRDNATKLLYFYGINNFNNFFKLLEYSLEINDPYISERMLASLYGIVLGKYNEWVKQENIILKKIALKIYEFIFSINAPFRTTHILARSYAQRIVELCIRSYPYLFNKEQVNNFTPPFPAGRVKEWGEWDYKHYDYGRYDPIRMDFSNYTIGRIVPNGGGYSNPPEKEKVRRQIYWRIHNLGWEVDRFNLVDRGIDNIMNSYSRVNKPTIERYGKKYSWIAFFELYGYRNDNNDLEEDDWRGFRTLESDIDPTFPLLLNNDKLFMTQDLLGNRTKTLNDWYNNSTLIDLNNLLKPIKLPDEMHNWVCLDGFVAQKDKTYNRELFLFIKAVIVKEGDYNSLIEEFKKDGFKYGRMSTPYQNHYTFAGEMNLVSEASYSNSLEINIEIKRSKKIVYKGDEGYFPDVTFSEKGIVTEYPIYREIDEITTQDFNILIPVAQYSWGNSTSSVNQAGGQNIVSKEISSYLDLNSKAQSFNLYDRDDELATKSYRYYKDHGTNQDFVFLRKDLLDKFLSENGCRLLWSLSGEKQISFENYDQVKEYIEQNNLDGHKEFNKIIEY